MVQGERGLVSPTSCFWKYEVKGQKQAQWEEDAGSWVLGSGRSRELPLETWHRWDGQVFKPKHPDVLSDEVLLGYIWV